MVLLKDIVRSLLEKSLEVLCILGVRRGLSFFHLEFVVSRSDYPRYDVGSFPVGSQFSMSGVFPRR